MNANQITFKKKKKCALYVWKQEHIMAYNILQVHTRFYEYNTYEF